MYTLSCKLYLVYSFFEIDLEEGYSVVILTHSCSGICIISPLESDFKVAL